MINFVTGVGWLTLFVIAFMIAYVVFASIRDAYRDSARYKKRQKLKRIRIEATRITQMHHAGMISGEVAARRLDRLANGETHV